MCESDTILEISPNYQGIGLDGAGGCDFDRQIMSVSAMVSGDLSRWHEDTLNNVKSLVNDPTMTAGQFPDGFFGTMLRTEDKAFSFCIVAQFAQKNVYSAAGMPGVYLFPFCFPLPFRRNLSTRAMRERIAFEAIPVSDGQAGGVLFYNTISANLPPPT